MELEDSDGCEEGSDADDVGATLETDEEEEDSDDTLDVCELSGTISQLASNKAIAKGKIRFISIQIIAHESEISYF